MESNYSKRELDHYFNDIRNQFLESIKNIEEKTHDIKEETSEIKVEAKKTNGRVRKLEKFMWAFGGSMAVILVILPFIFTEIRELKATVSRNNNEVNKIQALLDNAIVYEEK